MKIKNFILSIIMAVSAVTAHAYDIEDNGIYYNVVSLDEMTLAVAGGNWVGDVVIPSSVIYNGRKFTVTKLSKEAMKVDAGLNSVTLPSTIKEIEESAICDYRRPQGCAPYHLYIPKDNQIETLGWQAIGMDYGETNTLYFPKLRKYGFNAVRGVSAISIPPRVEFLTFGGKILFGCNRKVVFEEGSCENHNYDYFTGANIIAKVHELYLGRAMFFQENHKTYSFIGFEDVKKLTIARTPDDVYNMDFVKLDGVDTLICYAPTPPTSIRATTNSTYMNAKVFVPDASIEQYKSHEIWGKFWNIYPISQSIEKTQCEKPTILYVDGKLKIESSTSGSQCFYSISDADVVSDFPVNGDINLTATYNITAYAGADGYGYSETATATLCYIDGTFNTDGIETPQAAKRAVVISSNGGILTISGVEPGEEVSLYSISGSKITSVKASTSSVILDGKSLQSNVGIIKIGNESIKIQVK